MNWFAQLFSRRRIYSDLFAEIQEHLDERVEELIADGMARKNAEAAARREFGNATLMEEDSRDVWRWRPIENFAIDVRYGLRSLRRSPGFTIIVVLTLALGIGANSAIFSAIDAVLLRPLPFPNTSQLADLCARSTLFDFEHLGVSLPDIADIRASSISFSNLSPYQLLSKEMTGDGQPKRIEAADVSEDFFPDLGVKPLLGRSFVSSDMQPGSRAVILSHALWRDRFGGDPSAIGKTLRLDGETYTVIGVMPDFSSTDFATDCKVWTAFIPTQEQLTSRQNHYFNVLARLNPHTDIAQAQTELDTIASRLATAYPDADKGWSFRATPLRKYLLGDAQKPLLILFCSVGFVLLIACANVSNLFLSRGSARRREFAIRTAIGATRGALLRQLAVESVLVALMGGVCAFFMALWTVRGIRAILPPELPRIQDIRIDSEVVWFTLGASFLAALLSGFVPALLSSRLDVSVAIKEGVAGAGSGRGHNFLRQMLVIGEVALAIVLLIGATLAMQSFARILRVDPGFRPDHLITMRIDFPEFRFAKVEQSIHFVQQVLESSRGIPGVEAASAGIVFPLGDEVAETKFETEQSTGDRKSGQRMARNNQVEPDFFRTFGIPLVAGRDFNADDRKEKSPVFIVNEAFARKVFGSLDVVGRRLSALRESDRPVWGEIIGVAGNVRALDPGAEAKPEIYEPFAQTHQAEGVFLVFRTKPEPLAIVAAIEDRLWSLDKDRPVTSIKTIEKQMEENTGAPRSQSVLLGIFGGLGFVLAVVGVYGVMAYVVSQQTREIGIRMALGAAREKVLRMVIVHGLKLTLTGVAIGVGVSLTLTRFMRSQLLGVSTTDPMTFGGVAMLLIAVAVAACFVPAQRAMRVDPMVALRYE
ncbi:MAG TPA: ABC transporter permease [Candidatus Acidoferrum sp.]|nr:ABC transporter permease [Candidatus Acidoferrum sp.]